MSAPAQGKPTFLQRKWADRPPGEKKAIIHVVALTALATIILAVGHNVRRAGRLAAAARARGEGVRDIAGGLVGLEDAEQLCRDRGDIGTAELVGACYNSILAGLTAIVRAGR